MRPRRVAGKTDGDQVLPCGSDDAGAEVVDRECQQEEGQSPGGRPDCEERCCRQEDERHAFGEESQIDQPGFFAVSAFDRPGAEELGKEPAAVGDNCEQAEVEGVIGEPADEEGEDGGRRHETLGEQEEGAIDYIYGEVPVVVAPYFGLDVLIGTDGGRQIDLQHAAHHCDGESAGRDYGSEHGGFRELQFLVVSF